MVKGDHRGKNGSAACKRRVFLGSATLTSLGIASTSVTGANNSGKSNTGGSSDRFEDRRESNDHSKLRGTNTNIIKPAPDNAMSSQEVKRALHRIESKAGPEAAAKAFPKFTKDNSEKLKDLDAPSALSGTNTLEGVTRVDSWESSYNVENDLGVTIAETEHFLTLFKADEKDSSGDTVYLWRGYNYSDATDSTSKGKYATKSMTAEVQFRRDSLEFTQYQPDMKEEFGGSSGTITLNLGFAQISSEYGGGDGYMQPYPSKITTGYGETPPEQYEDEWNPDHDGAEFGYEVGGCIDGLATGSYLLDTRSPSPWGVWFRTDTTVRLASTCGI